MKHEIIKTENYLLVVDDSEIKEGDYHVAIRIVKTNGDKAIAFTDQEQLDAIAEIGGAKKIIAHLPLNNSPILQGVDLLPPLEQEDDVEKIADEYVKSQPIRNRSLTNDTWNATGFVEGYNKAKENLHKILSDFYFYATDGEVCNHEIINEFIQSLPQPKIPIGFECQTFDTGNDKLDGTHVLGIRTTTNSQGQTQWVGKYIYA